MVLLLLLTPGIFTTGCTKYNNNNNNTDANVYGAVIMASHCKSSPSSLDEMYTAPGDRRPLDQTNQFEPTDLPLESAIVSDYINHCHLL